MSVPKAHAGYVLRMFGPIDNPGDWFPAVSNTITLTSWEMGIERKQVKQISYTGEGALSASVLVECVP